MAGKDRDETPKEALWDEVEPTETAFEAPLYANPFVGREPCAQVKGLRPEVRDRVAQGCPRCGVQKDSPLPDELRSCLLEGVGLDLLALDAGGPPTLEDPTPGLKLERMKIEGSA